MSVPGPERRTRRRWPLVVGVVAVVVSIWASGIDLAAWTARLVAGADPLISALDPPPLRGAPVNLLVVGSDDRAGVDDLAGAFGSLTGRRADALALVSVGPSAVDVLSVPRDLRVTTVDGDVALATVLDAGGPAELVATVRRLTGTAVHHYVELEFAQVATLVDAVGGVEVAHAERLRDVRGGLEVPAGTVTLSGDAVVAYLRSRHLEAEVDDAWTALRSDDLARIDRRHRVAATVMRSLRTRSAADLADTVARLRSVDPAASTLGWYVWPRLARWVLRADAELCVGTLPVEPLRSRDERRSPFAPDHLGARHWLVPADDGRSPCDPAADTGGRVAVSRCGPPSVDCSAGRSP